MKAAEGRHESLPGQPWVFTARRMLVYVENLEPAIAYYRDILGFKSLGGMDGVNHEFATGGPPLVLHRGGKASLDPRPLSGFVPSLQVPSGIAELIEIYRGRGVRVVREVLEVAHGWIAFVADLEGNIIQIYQSKG